MTAPDVRLSPAMAVRLVAAREVRTRLRSKAFRISTSVTLLILIGFAVVMKLVAIRYTDMISAATVSSLRVLRSLLAAFRSGVSPFAAISGIIDTPVSKPDNPSTSNGNATIDGPAMSKNS